MAHLSEKCIKDFQKLVLIKRGIELSSEEAQTLALEWLEFFKLIYEPSEEDKNG